MSQVSSASKIWATGGESDVPTMTPKADANDAADFQRWLRPDPGKDPAAPSTLGEILHAASTSLHDRELAFTKTVQRAGRTGDPLDGLAVQRQLSELYLSHGLAVKVIGKTTQAMEQLMKLQ